MLLLTWLQDASAAYKSVADGKSREGERESENRLPEMTPSVAPDIPGRCAKRTNYLTMLLTLSQAP